MNIYTKIYLSKLAAASGSRLPPGHGFSPSVVADLDHVLDLNSKIHGQRGFFRP